LLEQLLVVDALGSALASALAPALADQLAPRLMKSLEDAAASVGQATEQGRETDGAIPADLERASARDAQARHTAGGRDGEQADRPAGSAAKASTVDVRFTLPADVHADTVALCGEFNNWSAQDILLQRGDDGSWQATVALQPGHSYRYRYLLDGERWENDWKADRYAPNSYGTTDSVIIVG
jgi:hypothetical protein